MGAASFVVKLGIVVPAFTCTYIYLLVDCNYVRQVSFKMSPGLSIGTVGQIKIGMYFSCQILWCFFWLLSEAYLALIAAAMGSANSWQMQMNKGGFSTPIKKASVLVIISQLLSPTIVVFCAVICT